MKKMLPFLSAITAILLAAACAQNPEVPAESKGSRFDGMTKGQMVKTMNITASQVDPSSDLSTDEIVVTWSVPFFYNNWSVSIKTDADGEEFQSLNDVEIVYEKMNVEYETVPIYVYNFKHKPVLIHNQLIIYYKISMTDHNGDEFESIVSFMIMPPSQKLKITVLSETNAKADSSLELVKCFHANPFIPLADSETFTLFEVVQNVITPEAIAAKLNVAYHELAPKKPVQFAIRTDFKKYPAVYETVKSAVHFSNTSYCKVTKVANPDPANIIARIKYNFEDLPANMIDKETYDYFDYNDVVFIVDILVDAK